MSFTSHLQDLIKEINANIHIISIDTDLLFTDYELNETFKKINSIKKNVYYHQIKSDHGHDAFFMEFNQIEDFLKTIFWKKSGVGGNRTLVQTTEILTFYKLSFHLIFDSILAENYTNTTYLLKFK